MSTRGFYNTDKHTCETHTRTHPDFASSCRWDLVRQVFTPVISHHLARHCLWQPHQPHNEDTWGKRRHRLSIKLLRREATAKWDIIMDIMEMFKHQGSLILYIYIYILQKWRTCILVCGFESLLYYATKTVLEVSCLVQADRVHFTADDDCLYK